MPTYCRELPDSQRKANVRVLESSEVGGGGAVTTATSGGGRLGVGAAVGGRAATRPSTSVGGLSTNQELLTMHARATV